MENIENQFCNFMQPVVLDCSDIRPWHVRISKLLPNKLFTLKGRITNRYYKWMYPSKQGNLEVTPLNLQVGNWVEVLPMSEIATTLDDRGRHKGLYFMPEMAGYCGKKFQVVKKVEKIKLESNGELRILRTPSYFLEGVYCDGKIQGGCDRSCFHFWRAAWLRIIPADTVYS